MYASAYQCECDCVYKAKDDLRCHPQKHCPPSPIINKINEIRLEELVLEPQGSSVPASPVLGL